MIIVFFGAPGVGKGTQAALLAERVGFGHLSTGEALRNAIAAQTDVGKIAQQIVQSGGLVPDEIVTQIVEETLQKPQFQKGAILDGYPRTIGQATALDAILAAKNSRVSVVVNITVNKETIVQRLLARGRKDDAEETIRARFDVYEKETAPLLDYYAKTPNLVQTLDGDADVETVYERVKAAVAVAGDVVG
jgi:adenylate kinase